MIRSFATIPADGRVVHMVNWHSYRLEVSGGHTGSGKFFYGLATSRLSHVEAFIRGEVSNGQSASGAVIEGFAGVVELYENEVRVHRTSFWPALSFQAGGHAFTHDGRLWCIDGAALTPEAKDLEYAEALEEALLFSAIGTVTVDLSALNLPEPKGEPVEAGTLLKVETLAGQPYDHPCGHQIGPLWDGFNPASSRAFTS